MTPELIKKNTMRLSLKNIYIITFLLLFYLFIFFSLYSQKITAAVLLTPSLKYNLAPLKRELYFTLLNEDFGMTEQSS